MGHHTTFCSFSGLPITGGDFCYRLDANGTCYRLNGKGFGPYDCMQSLAQWKRELEENSPGGRMYDFHKELRDKGILINDWCEAKVEDLMENIPFSLHEGEYSGYGDFKDEKPDRQGQDYIDFLCIWIHRNVMDWIRTKFGADIMDIFCAAFDLRLDLNFHRPITGRQDIEKEELEIRKEFLEVVQRANNAILNEWDDYDEY